MSQRASGFARIEKDLYPTRERWVIDALCDYFPVRGAAVWECAASGGHMVRHLVARGASVFSTDIQERDGYALNAIADFAKADIADSRACDLIITNPPYGTQGKLAEQFIANGLRRIRAGQAKAMAMLLPVDFDSASTRTPLFRDAPEFAAKIVLLKRIRWFDPPPRKPGEKAPAGPSANHCWLCWIGTKDPSRRHSPATYYWPKSSAEGTV